MSPLWCRSANTNIGLLDRTLNTGTWMHKIDTSCHTASCWQNKASWNLSKTTPHASKMTNQHSHTCGSTAATGRQIPDHRPLLDIPSWNIAKGAAVKIRTVWTEEAWTRNWDARLVDKGNSSLSHQRKQSVTNLA